jgi:4-amino-4-deoxy-L-arabinose transferase-like glycosyltransferase
MIDRKDLLLSHAWRIGLVLGACLLLFFYGLGAPPFFDKQEAREALVIREIHHSGNWILPLRNGNEIPAKPPFFHWLAAATANVTGKIDEFTTRFPSAVLGSAGVLLTYGVGALLWGPTAGVVSALVLCTSFEWHQAARVTRVDMALTFVMLCYFLFFLYLYRSGGSRGKAIVFGVLLGLATLAKGPLGFVIPCFAVVAFLWVRKDWNFLTQLHPFTVCAIIAGSWYVAAYEQGGKDFLTVVIRENLPFLIGEDSGHPHPFYWYIPYLLRDIAPWSFFFPALGVFIYQRRHRLDEEKLLYFLIWFGTVFLFFSAFSQKRTVYILSLYPAIALMFGAWWQKLYDEASTSLSARLARFASAVTALTYLVLSAALLNQATRSNFLSSLSPALGDKDQAGIKLIANLLIDHRITSFSWAALCASGGIFLLFSLRKNAWGHIIGCTAILGVVSLLYVQHFDTYLAREYSFKTFMVDVAAIVNDRPLFFYDSTDYAVQFYARGRVPRFRDGFVENQSPVYLLIWDNEWRANDHRQPFSVRARSAMSDMQIPQRGHLNLLEVLNK